MMAHQEAVMLDPLAVFLRSAYDSRGLTPIPLISTEHDVVIASGLAVVATHRVFKNQEFENIEAVLSSTLYVHAAKQSACAIRSMRIGGILCVSRSGGER
jgi:hypothetical protein